jgi:hypothetical protein
MLAHVAEVHEWISRNDALERKALNGCDIGREGAEPHSRLARQCSRARASIWLRRALSPIEELQPAPLYRSDM